MKLKNYIQGKRRGKEAHQLERKAMDDPFLQDAIDGFDTVEGDHLRIIEDIEKRIEQKSKKIGSSRWTVIGIAASIALLIAAGSFFYLNSDLNNETSSLALDSSTQKVETQQEHVYNKTEEATDTKDIKSVQYSPTSPPVPVFDNHSVSDNDAIIAAEKTIIVQKQNSDKSFSPHIVTEDIDAVGLTENKSIVQREPEITNDYEMITNEVAASDYKKNVPSAARTKTEALKVLERTAKKESADHKSTSAINIFEEKEFKLYFEKNKRKDIVCSEKDAKIIVTFSIDKTGTPQNIKTKESNCKPLENEIIKVLQEGPKWTALRQIILTIQY